MEALFYLQKRTFINYFKRLKKNPKKAIGPIVFIFWLVMILIPNGKSSSSNDTKFLTSSIFVTIFFIITTLYFLYSLYSGSKKVNSQFLLSDVNLIFTSPIKPQTILVFGVLKKMVADIFISVYFLYQIPRILTSLNVKIANQIIIIITFIVFQFIFCNCLKIFIFALCAKYSNLPNIIKNTLKIFLLILFALLGLYIFLGDIQLRLLNINNYICNSKIIDYIPIIGWIKFIVLKSMTSINPLSLIFLVLILIISVILLRITYFIKLDYYEDVLSSAADNEFANKAKNGKLSANEINEHNNQNLTFKIKNIKLKLDGVYGAKTIFYKHINEYFKKSFFFFINLYSIFLLGGSLGFAIVCKEGSIRDILIGGCALMIFASLNSKIYNEINFHYIYLLPDSTAKKLFYSISSSLIKSLVDALLLFIPSGIILRQNFLFVILCIVCYVTLAYMLSLNGLFTFKILEFIGLNNSTISGLLLIILQIILFIPIISLLITSNIFNLSFIFYILFLLYTVLVSFLLTLGCRSILDNMEQHTE